MDGTFSKLLERLLGRGNYFVKMFSTPNWGSSEDCVILSWIFARLGSAVSPRNTNFLVWKSNSGTVTGIGKCRALVENFVAPWLEERKQRWTPAPQCHPRRNFPFWDRSRSRACLHQMGACRTTSPREN